MADDPLSQLLASLKGLRPDQLERVDVFVRALKEPPVCTFTDTDFTKDFAHEFNDRLRLHHQGSAEPFTKDKSEYAMVAILKRLGRKAELAPKGNPGHDLTVDGQRWSLKTQADASIKRDSLWISKFMELGKGKWDTYEDLVALRDQFLKHLTAYDRIFSLRCFRTPMLPPLVEYEYELVEIPKDLLLRAKDGDLKFTDKSKQNPRPAYCTVTDGDKVLYRLYFDAGSERKLQIKALDKSRCTVHATWKIGVTS